MKKIFLSRCLITFGLLFFTLHIPFITTSNVMTASAASVEEEKSDFKLNVMSNTLVKGKSFNLKVYNLNTSSKVSFKSNDSEIASVSEDGTVTAIKVGFTTITVTVKEGFKSTSLTSEITVGPPAISVKLTKSRIIIGKDKIDLLKVILKPSNTAEDAKFSSYDTSIASVTVGGRVIAKDLGFTYLFAEIGEESLDNRKFAVCSIIVTQLENVEDLEMLFNEHPGLDLIAEQDLALALEEFFNRDSDGTTKLTQAKELYRFLNGKFDLEYLDSLCTIPARTGNADNFKQLKYSFTQSEFPNQ